TTSCPSPPSSFSSSKLDTRSSSAINTFMRSPPPRRGPVRARNSISDLREQGDDLPIRRAPAPGDGESRRLDIRQASRLACTRFATAPNAPRSGQTMRQTMIALAIAALAGSAQAQNGDTITLGASVQLTGRLANTVRYYGDGYALAIEQVNKKGGVSVGGKKYKLALQILDNQSDVNLSVRQYTQLLSENKVNFLLGPFASDFALSDSAVAEKNEVPMVQGGGASTQIFSRGFKYVFGTLPPADDYFSSTIQMLQKL